VFDTISKTAGSREYNLLILNNSNTQYQRVVAINNRSDLLLSECDIFYDNNLVASIDAIDTGTEYKLYLVSQAGLTGIITYRGTLNTIIDF